MKNILFFVFTVLFLSGCMKENPQLIKETDANKKVVLSFFNTALNKRDPVKAVSEFIPDAVAHSIKGVARFVLQVEQQFVHGGAEGIDG